MTTVSFDTPLDLARMRHERHTRLVDALRAHGLDATLLLGESNVGYATGTRVPAADQARAIHRRPVALVTSDGEAPHVWTWCLEGAPDGLPPEHLHPGSSLESDAGARALLDTVSAWIPPGGTLGFDEATMPLRSAIRDSGRDFVDASPALGQAKLRKTPDELACIRRAQAINEAAIAAVAPLAHEGTTGTALTGRFLQLVLELGASRNNVDPIWQVMPQSIADGPFSATGGVVFPTVTTARPLRAAMWSGSTTGSRTRATCPTTGIRGSSDEAPDAKRRDQCRRWRDVVDATLASVRPGATARDLTRGATDAAGTGQSPWLPHLYLAHGTGTDSAEPPFVGTDLGPEFDETVVLEQGMVMVLEPVIWDDGRAGFRAEQIVAVTDDGWTSLSNLGWDGWE